MGILLVGCGPASPDELERRGDEAATVEEAAKAYQAACDRARIRACLKLALLDGADEADRRAAAEVACEAGEADACLVRSTSPGDAWRRRACEEGRGSACLDAAAVAEGRARARLLAQACHQAELQACLPAALAWRALGALERSAALYGVGCEGGVEGACWLRDRVQAEAARAEACAAGSSEGCMQRCLEDGVGCEALAPALEEACRSGGAVACTRRGLVGADLGAPDAGDWLWRGCDQVDPWACLLLADRVEAGMPLPEKARGGVAWLRNQACDLQLDYGCAMAPSP